MGIAPPLAVRRCEAPLFSGTRKPQNRNASTKFLEVSVGCHEDSLTGLGQGRRKAVHVRYFVARLDFPRLERLLEIHRDRLYR